MKILDRQLGKKALVQGYLEILGEKYRPLFNEVADKLIDLGIQNGRSYYRQSAILKCEKLIGSFKFMQEDHRMKVIHELGQFFTQAELLKLTTNKSEVLPFRSLYTVGIGPYQQRLIESIDVKDFVSITSPAFEYFKHFPVYKNTNLSLFDECGLNLETLSARAIEYMKTEGELSTLVEEIAVVFNSFGMFLGQIELVQEFTNKIKAKAKGMHWQTTMTLGSFIKGLCLESYEDMILTNIQASVGIDGFETESQLEANAAAFAKKNPDLLKLFQK